MISLEKLLIDVKVETVTGDLSVSVSGITMDSGKVERGSCFVAIKGTVHDGHAYIQKSIEAGAVAVVCNQLPSNLTEGVTYVCVADTSMALGVIASNFYARPSSKMRIVGITGTNGKTSVATLLFRLFRARQEKVGLLSTVQNQIDDKVINATHTTPNPVELNKLMAKMVEHGCSYCFMEVSSHAVDQKRISGIKFTGAVFTNITHDHLDYHKTFEHYLRTKKRFFDDLPSEAFALINVDDRNGMVMLQNTKATKYTYSLKSPSDFKCKIIDNSIGGLQLELDNTEMHTRLIGEFNAYNLTAVYAAARLLGLSKEESLQILSSLTPPEGRFDQFISSQEAIVGIVDYAHTPDALKNVLQTIKAVRNGNENVITVVGCGGDRDSAKRPVMAEIACKYSEQVILTSDNPRSEDPEMILKQMNEGVPVSARRKVLTITDRKQAIRTAVTLAHKKDIILLAGKGHEKYQDIGGVKHFFDDKLELATAFSELNK